MTHAHLEPCGAAFGRLDPDTDPDPDRRVSAAAIRAWRHGRRHDGADGRRRCRDRARAAPFLRARPLDPGAACDLSLASGAARPRLLLDLWQAGLDRDPGAA